MGVRASMRRPAVAAFGRGRSAGALVVLAIGLTTSGAVLADPTVDQQQIFYDIGGKTPREWNQQMTKAAADGRTGGSHYAYCAWHVNWKYRYSPHGNECHVDSITVDASIKTTLPRLATVDDLPTEARRQWSTFYTALRQHEDGHARHGLEAAAEIEALSELTAPRCADLDALLARQAKAVIEKYKAADKTYDARTGHGRTQGAWLESR